ncbi:MAG: hypothetical protein AAF383_07635 [Cyanobacteria bacterium P01_A01_bin.83]
MIEFWNVATRPSEKNGLGYDVAKATQSILELKRLFTLLPDLPDVYPIWERLAIDYQVKGVNVHDTKLVAFMLVHEISHVLTFNSTDFQRFNSEIVVVHPDNIN